MTQQRQAARSFGLCCLVVALLGAQAARADAPTNAEDAKTLSQAKSLLDEGTAQYALGHFQEALNDFEKVYLLRHVPGLLFNIAQCHRQLRNFAEAAVTYRSFIRLNPKSAQLENAKDLLAQVEEALRMQQAAQTSPPLEPDGPNAGSLSPPANANLSSGAPINSTSSSAPVVATTSPTIPAPLAQRRAPFVAWIVGGAGVAALATGTVFGLLSKSTASDMTSAPHSRADVANLQNSLDTQAGAANALFAVGGGLLTVGSVLFVLRY